MTKKVLRDGESNPGLPRDRRGYSPLYYRGAIIASIFEKFEPFDDKLLSQANCCCSKNYF